MNRFADPEVGPAPADVSRHCIVNLSIAWRGVLGEQSGSRHNLPRLAISALRNLLRDPGLLHGMQTTLPEPLNRHNLLAGGTRNVGKARAHSLSVEMNCAGAAHANSAAVLGSCELQQVPKNPQQRHLAVSFKSVQLPVDFEGELGHF